MPQCFISFSFPFEPKQKQIPQNGHPISLTCLPTGFFARNEQNQTSKHQHHPAFPWQVCCLVRAAVLHQLHWVDTGWVQVKKYAHCTASPTSSSLSLAGLLLGAGCGGGSGNASTRSPLHCISIIQPSLWQVCSSASTAFTVFVSFPQHRKTCVWDTLCSVDQPS